MGRPSHFLADMRKVAAKVGVSDDLVRHRFQQALPATIGPIIASQKASPLDDLGKLADELLTLCPRGEAVCSIKASPIPSKQPYVKPFINYKDSNRSDLTLTPFSSGQRAKICRSHIFFADKARNCRSWCKWPNKSGCTIVQSNKNTPRNSRASSPTRQENY